MPRDTKTTCDQCGADLSMTTNCEAYCLALVNVRIPSCRGAVTSMATGLCIPSDSYFCDLHCLAEFMRDFPRPVVAAEFAERKG